MKVYELKAELNGMPEDAEVVFSALVDVKEVEKAIEVDIADNGNPLYPFDREIVSVMETDDGKVTLFSEQRGN